MKPLLAKAIVKKKSPKLSVREIYGLKDDVKVGKDEKIIKIKIQAI